ncbi:MAG: cobyrinate a,c-diamide synthase [Deltaproteobacteria bacterium]|nr:cobyrinate a,c-diamide synthase [Deltaproteobacteria bacterium]
MTPNHKEPRLRESGGLPGDIPVLAVAGTHSGSGKTTVAIGLMAALSRRGLTVQGFKVGPDFIDPGHHRAVTGRESHNLDGWMMTRDANRDLFLRGLQDADVGVVEGVMGLFDGVSGGDEKGSTARMAKDLGVPVLLVVDARSMARSAAAVALGFARFDPDLTLAGVVFNRVGSRSHAGMLEEAMKAVPDLPILGCLPREEGLEIPSRHLGLVTAEDHVLDAERADRLARWVEKSLDLDRLLDDAPRFRASPPATRPPGEKTVRIGLARDEAFCFYYAENLRLLEAEGAELVPFSPIRDRELPDGVCGLYLGGGYPELHCETLSANRGMKRAIRSFVREGGTVYAECGGFMYLMNTIQDLEGRTHRMTGLFPFEAVMEPRLRSLGYREIMTTQDSPLGPAGTRARGHEFHYSRMKPGEEEPRCIYAVTGRGSREETTREGFLAEGALGSYIHLHWGSNTGAARAFVEACAGARG